jgi:hypothetical protein
MDITAHALLLITVLHTASAFTAPALLHPAALIRRDVCMRPAKPNTAAKGAGRSRCGQQCVMVGDMAVQAPTSEETKGGKSHTTDVVVIGSGLGGLCAGALLAKYGYKVTICEVKCILFLDHLRNADYSMYSILLTASPGSVLFNRSTPLKRKDLCFSCLRLGLVTPRSGLRS